MGSLNVETAQTYQQVGLHKQGAQAMKEVSKTLKRLVSLLKGGGQLGAAEEAPSSTINPLPENGHEYLFHGSHRVLGNIYHSRGNT